MTDNVQDTLTDGSKGKREFARLEYPPKKRPSLKFGENVLGIMDISEKWLKLLNDKQIDIGRIIYGEAVLLSGRSISVDGDVVWISDTEIGLLMALKPSSCIHNTSRFPPVHF